MGVSGSFSSSSSCIHHTSSHIDRFLKRVFHPEEIDTFKSKQGHPAFVYLASRWFLFLPPLILFSFCLLSFPHSCPPHRWAVKESVFKAVGGKFRLQFPEIQVQHNSRGIVLLSPFYIFSVHGSPLLSPLLSSLLFSSLCSFFSSSIWSKSFFFSSLLFSPRRNLCRSTAIINTRQSEKSDCRRDEYQCGQISCLYITWERLCHSKCNFTKMRVGYRLRDKRSSNGPSWAGPMCNQQSTIQYTSINTNM